MIMMMTMTLIMMKMKVTSRRDGEGKHYRRWEHYVACGAGTQTHGARTHDAKQRAHDAPISPVGRFSGLKCPGWVIYGNGLQQIAQC